MVQKGGCNKLQIKGGKVLSAKIVCNEYAKVQILCWHQMGICSPTIQKVFTWELKGIAKFIKGHPQWTTVCCRTSLGWMFRESEYCQLIREINKQKRLNLACQIACIILILRWATVKYLRNKNNFTCILITSVGSVHKSKQEIFFCGLV